MRPSFVSRAVVLTAFVVLFVSALATLAGDGRDFSGFYELSNVTEQVDDAWVTLTLELSNHRNTDCYNVTLTLENWLQPDQDFGTLSAASIGGGDSVRLSGNFLVPLEEYEGWQQGTPPRLRIEFSDAAGNPGMNMVELVMMPLPEEV